ncbi:M20 family metallopeptidase [Oceanobacillus sp. CAU 1775]
MEEVLDVLKQLIRNENTSPENINKSMDYCSNWLEAHGINVTNLENKGSKMLVATVGEKGPTIILNGHIDVVPGNPEDFIPRIENNRIYGRGSYDMLGSVAIMLKLMTELAKVSLNCKVMLVIVPDEEVGGHIGTKYLVENGYIGDMVICGEPTDLKIAIQAKGILHLELEVSGLSAHGSRPWLGENAILMAINRYKELIEAKLPSKETEFFESPSFNLATITGGAVLNQVPSSCVIGIDIRYLPGQNPDDFMNKIKMIDPTAKLKIIRHGHPVNTDKNNRFVKQLYESVESTIDHHAVFFGQAGSSDARFYSEHNIPAVEFGPIGANHHAPNEYVDINSLKQYKDILKNYILDMRVEDKNEISK